MLIGLWVLAFTARWPLIEPIHEMRKRTERTAQNARTLAITADRGQQSKRNAGAQRDRSRR